MEDSMKRFYALLGLLLIVLLLGACNKTPSQQDVETVVKTYRGGGPDEVYTLVPGSVKILEMSQKDPKVLVDVAYTLEFNLDFDDLYLQAIGETAKLKALNMPAERIREYHQKVDEKIESLDRRYGRFSKGEQIEKKIRLTMMRGEKGAWEVTAADKIPSG
jgi:hypothetical protein